MTPLQEKGSDIHAILKKHWGYDSFRPLQEDIIHSVLSGRDTLGLMPTGGGKSLTFQVPGMSYEKGVTVVVTPLVSLMKDQVDNLKRRRIHAVYLHAGMRAGETHRTWEKLVNGHARFLYISPERLSNERFMLEMRSLTVNLIVVDEAHCISQWGYDFRPSYLGIKKLRRLKPDVPVLALTATATPAVADDICRQLEFRDGSVFRKSFARPNLSYIVRRADVKIHEMLHILQNTSGCAIVYQRSRKKCRETALYLQEAGIAATFYHAGLDFKEKEQRQESWRRGEVRVMVATNAFGMGIDKADVRVVIHCDIPPSLEEYYQEAGRAGRDGEPAYAVLLVSKTDRALMHRRITEAFPPRSEIKKTYERICNFLHVSVGEGYGTCREFDISKFMLAFRVDERLVRSSLRLLVQAGYLEFIESADSRSRILMTVDRDELYRIHDLSPAAESVLAACLRMYTGLFSDFQYVWEPEVASRLKVSENIVYEAMLELSRKKILKYIPRSSLPTVCFCTAREETGSLLIGKEIYEKRREEMEKRTEAMLDYAANGGSCRVGRMLAYFGEEGAGDCGTCDVCRDKKKRGRGPDPAQSEEAVAARILAYISKRENGAMLRFIERECGTDPAAVARVLNMLCNEGCLKARGDLYFICK